MLFPIKYLVLEFSNEFQKDFLYKQRQGDSRADFTPPLISSYETHKKLFSKILCNVLIAIKYMFILIYLDLTYP